MLTVSNKVFTAYYHPVTDSSIVFCSYGVLWFRVSGFGIWSTVDFR